MKSIFLILIFFLGLINYSVGQITLDYSVQQTIDFFKTNQYISEAGNKILTENNIKGSPYLNDEFVNGSIYTVQKLQYNDIPLRYNIYNDDLEFKTPEDVVQALSTPDIVEKAVFGKTHLVYSPYLLSGKNKKGFFVVLEEGKLSLYAKPGILFREATAAGAYKEPEPPKFVKKSDEYYLRFGSKQAEIIGSKKDLIAAFPDNRDKVKSFMSKNKIKTNKPETLKELVKYYNSL